MPGTAGQEQQESASRPAAPYDSTIRTIHVMVALCDNKYQGIVPVPGKIGNGQDPGNNLYWGCAFGIRAFFSKSKDWQLLRTIKPGGRILERLVFRHKNAPYYLVADAYDGGYIKECTIQFLENCAGTRPDTLHAGGKIIGTGANAQLLCYIGHDGLMDFNLDKTFKQADGKKRDAIILACYSKRFFAEHLRPTGAQPLLWSTGLMSPEAYTLYDALDAYIRQQPVTVLRQKAAGAYSRYQKCSNRAAMNLLVSGY